MSELSARPSTGRPGLDLVIHLDAEETAAVGADAEMLAGWTADVMDALTDLRLGTWADDPDRARAGAVVAINAVYHRLTPRLRGVLDAAVRAHRAAGGSVRDLQTAMDTAHPSGAQYARDRLPADPGLWEMWATGTQSTTTPTVPTGTADTTHEGDDDMGREIIHATNIAMGNAHVGRQVGTGPNIRQTGGRLVINGRAVMCGDCDSRDDWRSVRTEGTTTWATCGCGARWPL